MKTIKDFEEDFNFNIKPQLLARLRGLNSQARKDVDRVNKFLVSSMTELLESLRMETVRDDEEVSELYDGFDLAIKALNSRIDSML